MNPLRNEKGNALLFVLLVTVVISTIGLAVVASTIGGAKRTTVRVADVDVTYEAVKSIDSYSAELSDALRSDRFELFKTSDEGSVNLEPVTPSNIDILLEGTKTEISNTLKAENEAIVTIDVHDVTDNYPINKAESLTRVLEVSITANEPDGSAVVSRTAKKELIISPLPSFLKYALGSEKGTLTLNGSPHLEGNIFANKLSIDKNAYYNTSTGRELDSETPMPSISGDLYVGTPDLYTDWNFDPTALTKELVPENFYYEKVPMLKNDSQYQSIEFNQAYKENRNSAEGETIVPPATALDNGAINLTVQSGIPLVNSVVGGIMKLVPQTLSEYASKQPNISNVNYVGNAVVRPIGTLIKNINVKGSLTIYAQDTLTIENISVSGGVLNIVNEGSGTVTLNKNIVSDSGLTLENKTGTINTKTAKLYDELAITIKNESGNMNLGSMYSQEDAFITNGNGKIKISAPLQTGKNLLVDNKGDLSIDFPAAAANSVNTVYSLGNVKITSDGNFELKNHLEAAGSITLDLTNKAAIEGLILSQSNINLYAKDSKKEDSIEDDHIYFDGALFTEENLTIQGGVEQDGQAENDLFSINGTMYARGETKISNLSIRGWNDGQLVSLSGGSLLITRINEFQNFEDSDEPEEGPYVPEEDSNRNVQPLKGFFYTDKDVEASLPKTAAAELYGVGSLFFVDGGLFAKGDFVINAVRGDTNGYDITSAVPGAAQQTDHYSRFIINYNRNILLGQLDYLPRVKYLSVYSDQLTLE
ncbi:hypothetical protein NLX67_09235 [Domibacillus sp. A3M-37]|uniref:hypothetical protein n=1 Tax=Domibacillus sp. A3M-37 TaxID=2962037 RepID=UPI0020B75A64|nr:hypothetical protein [Domibacillus sp. A3M-37]MCP3762572.1 hypothetical protein [Domibacillus sp. A3M-37]